MNSLLYYLEELDAIEAKGRSEGRDLTDEEVARCDELCDLVEELQDRGEGR